MEIALAITAAAVLGSVVGAMFGEASLSRYLVDKAKPKYRTAAKLGDGFYYIVPEREYVRLR